MYVILTDDNDMPEVLITQDMTVSEKVMPYTCGEVSDVIHRHYFNAMWIPTLDELIEVIGTPPDLIRKISERVSNI